MRSSAASRDLASCTTLRLGGPARRMVDVASQDALVAAIREADEAGEPLLLLGGGSNLVVADAGFDGVVVRILTSGAVVHELDDDHVELVVAAGEPWDDVVARAVDEGLSGMECLSGIPGSTGATPIQNVGAYGASVDELITRVRVWDRRDRAVAELPPVACGFGYRTSVFKHDDRYAVLEVAFRLRRSDESMPVRYAELARTLDAEVGERAPLGGVREAVLALRRSKGMVLDPSDPDSVSAGSFFTNPILDRQAFAELEARVAERPGAEVRPPSWPDGDRVKTSAAWLIERSGFTKGFGEGRVGLSSKHTLALVNRGGATTEELLELARTVRDGVLDSFGVELHPEPTLVGVSL